MIKMIILFVFIAILVLLIFGAIGMWIAGQKGKSTTLGFLLGFFIPIIGLIIIGSYKQSDKELVEEMYERKLISKEEYENTMEIKINNK